jgi:hypothetical protein
MQGLFKFDPIILLLLFVEHLDHPTEFVISVHVLIVLAEHPKSVAERWLLHNHLIHRL